MDEHPSIHFVDGAMGRRPAVLGTGLDVWEIVAVAKDNAESVASTAAYLEIDPPLVESALAYYRANQEQIDDWIARVHEVNEREEAASKAMDFTMVDQWGEQVSLPELKLLLDEHLSPEIARQLRERGHDVVAVRERAELSGRPERMRFASLPDEQRAIVTRDLADYRPLLDDELGRGGETYGLICVEQRFSLNGEGIGRLVRALEALLEGHPETDGALAVGGDLWLEDSAAA